MSLLSFSPIQGYAQISLADFDLDVSQTRWYNILHYSLLRPDQLSRDDQSSKSSTLRSSVSASNVKVSKWMGSRQGQYDIGREA